MILAGWSVTFGGDRRRGSKKADWQAWPKIQKHKLSGGLGFRDFTVFNQALLARQAWRLLTKPESLCAQVLKAHYYPAGRLAVTWQAIHYGLELLKKGLIWRVGSRAQIRIWRGSVAATGAVGPAPHAPRDMPAKTRRGPAGCQWRLAGGSPSPTLSPGRRRRHHPHQHLSTCPR